MSNSLYVYTGKNDEVKLFTAENRKENIDTINKQVTDYFQDERPELSHVDYDILGSHIINRGIWHGGVTCNNLFHKLGKHNVLFVTNYNDSQFDSFRINHPEVSNPDAYKHNLASLWFPMFVDVMENQCSVKYTASFVSGHQSLLKYMFGKWNVPVTNSNKKYELGIDDWEIEQPESRYDAVIMVGIPNPSGQVHNIEDIKSTFAPYCTDDFILLDMFEDDNGRLEAMKLWPNFDVEELKRISLERTKRIEGDKLNVVEEFRTINTYSLFTDVEMNAQKSNIQWNRTSDIQVEYFMDFY